MSNDNTPRAILCPHCGKLINANAEQCIHCGYKNPGKPNLGSMFQRMFKGNMGFVQLVTGFCISLYLLSLLLDPSAILQQTGMLGLLSPSGVSLDKLGMTGSYAMAHGRWWTLITAIYLHGGLLHIVFNLLWIRQLGPAVEQFFGAARLILIFTFSGVLGFVVSNLVGIPFTIGASGSIFGLLGALIFYGRDRGGVFGQAMFRQLLGWAVILFLFGFFMSGINNFAHGGGFIGGYLSAKFFGYMESKQETQLHRRLAAVTIIITIVSFMFAFINGITA